jgi:hypothetical protein
MPLGHFWRLLGGLWLFAGLHSLLNENLLFEVSEACCQRLFFYFRGSYFQAAFLGFFCAHLLILRVSSGTLWVPWDGLCGKLWSPGCWMGSKVAPGFPKDLFWEPFECRLGGFGAHVYIWGAWLGYFFVSLLEIAGRLR